MYRLNYIFIITALFATHYLTSQNTIGTVLNTPQALDGLTLITPNSNEIPNFTYLINNCGEIVNQWESDFKGQGADIITTTGDLYRGAFDDNSTLNYAGNNGRLERYNWDGDLTWSLTYSEENFSFHHDFYVLDNGNILLLVAERKGLEAAIDAGRDPSTLIQDDLYTEKIIEIEPINEDDFNIVWEWDIWDHLIQDFDSTKDNFGVISAHPERLNINYTGLSNNIADWIHLNSIDYNKDLDQILISSRFTSELYIIDHSTNSTEASGNFGGNSNKGGGFLYRWGNPQAYNQGNEENQQLFGQHSVHWTRSTNENFGKILLFNNGLTRGYSNVVLIDTPDTDDNGNYTIIPNEPFLPLNSNIVYEANPKQDFFAPFLSSAYELENGNFLINNGPIGETFEVDSQGLKVWSYISPITVSNGTLSQGDSPPGINARFFRTRKYTLDYEGFEGRDLTSSGYLENNPQPENCNTLSTPMFKDSINLSKLYPNPTSSSFFIEGFNEILSTQVYNLQGRLIISSNKNQLDLTNYADGIYIVFITTSNQTERIKLIKK
ncbi:aryl-sulfate sulfotransferase [uncultured Dokdonia sp.]|uniref:aryl-sulfate sulfotransferase n=1 Tax=uncultured Dokdonia sp. TaxID=575653 RepID=UPI0030ECDCE3|tara:strand:+ start:19911 stop:21563 length:1653 start_codon:yes stop_codon:yes gene_type:complete